MNMKCLVPRKYSLSGSYCLIKISYGDDVEGEKQKGKKFRKSRLPVRVQD